MALSNILKYAESDEFSTIVFDTAPTGHTLRLLALPSVLKAGIEKLQSWRVRLGGVFAAVAGAMTQDKSKQAQADALNTLKQKLVEYQESVERIAAMFTDADKTNFVCVCIAEHLSVYETARLVHELNEKNVASSHVIVNQLVFVHSCMGEVGRTRHICHRKGITCFSRS